MSPRTTEQLAEIREQSRTKILDAAFELFAKQGFNNTSISQIAKKAGVSKGLIYNYVEKKEDLMNLIVHRGFSLGSDMLTFMMSRPPGKERLKSMFEFGFSFIVDNLEVQRLMSQISLQLDQFPEIAESVKAKYTDMMPLLTQLLEESGHPDPASEGRLLGAIMDGLAIQYIVLGDALPLEQIKNDLIQKYCS